MATSIGNVNVTYLSARAGGRVMPLTTKLEISHRPGANGDTVRDEGQSAENEQMQFMHLLADLSAADTFCVNLGALVGTQVTLTLDDGQTYANCLIIGFAGRTQYKVLDNGSEKYKVEMTLIYRKMA